MCVYTCTYISWMMFLPWYSPLPRDSLLFFGPLSFLVWERSTALPASPPTWSHRSPRWSPRLTGRDLPRLPLLSHFIIMVPHNPTCQYQSESLNKITTLYITIWLLWRYPLLSLMSLGPTISEGRERWAPFGLPVILQRTITTYVDA